MYVFEGSNVPEEGDKIKIKLMENEILIGYIRVCKIGGRGWVVTVANNETRKDVMSFNMDDENEWFWNGKEWEEKN